MTKTAQIAAILERRYPCQAIPAGAQADIAAEVGVSRELVRQVANRMGLVTPGSSARRSRVPVRLCITCNEPLPLYGKRPYHTGRCRPTMTAPCEWCGTPVTRFISDISSSARNSPRHGMAFTGQVFCNKVCQGTWLGSTNTGKKHRR